MKVWKIVFGGGLLALAALVSAAGAETRYVSDVLVINVREAPKDAAPTVEHLRTGDAMEVLGAEGEYLKVRTESGVVGWVAAQYTSEETPKAVVIRRQQEELSRLKVKALEGEEEAQKATKELEASRGEQAAEVQNLEGQLAQARSEAKQASSDLADVTAKYEQLRKQSGSVLDVVAERDRLKSENQKLSGRLGKVEAERATLTRTTAIRWFLAGAGVLLVGWLAGLSSRKKRGRFSAG